MKNWLHLLIVIVLVGLTCFHGMAQEESHDTVYFYNSWEQISYNVPEIGYVDPFITMHPPYTNEYYIDMADDQLNIPIREQFIVAYLHGVWLISSNYLKRHFKGETKIFSDNSFVALYYNEKVAYVDYEWPRTYDFDREFFYLDFKNRRVSKVEPSMLSRLFEEWAYYDLRMRFEGMKDHKKREIIDEYFFKFIDRATTDDKFPTICDIIHEDSTDDMK